jgi:hypothetical protein
MPVAVPRDQNIAARPYAAIGVLTGLLLLTGCSARPLPVRPAEAIAAAAAHPEVAAWYEAHAAPRVLEGLSPAAARGLQRFRPDALVDLVGEGLLVRFTSALGEQPRRVEVLVDQTDGRVLGVRMGGAGWRGWR